MSRKTKSPSCKSLRLRPNADFNFFPEFLHSRPSFDLQIYWRPIYSHFTHLSIYSHRSIYLLAFIYSLISILTNIFNSFKLKNFASVEGDISKKKLKTWGTSVSKFNKKLTLANYSQMICFRVIERDLLLIRKIKLYYRNNSK